MRRETCSLAFDAAGPFGTALPLEMSKTEELEALLSRVLCTEPQFGYVLPDEQARLRFLRGFFANAIRASKSNGEIYTTPGIDGGALWIGPGRGLTVASMMTVSTVPSLEWDCATLKRCVNLVTHLDEIHQHLVRGLHWHLLALGVKPSRKSENVEGVLLAPVLTRADSDGLPCYLETFNDRNLPLYERHGFRIAGSGKIPGGGPDFWAMIRRPQSP